MLRTRTVLQNRLKHTLKSEIYLNTHLHRLPHGRSQGHPIVQTFPAFNPAPLLLTLWAPFSQLSCFNHIPRAPPYLISLFQLNGSEKSVIWVFTSDCFRKNSTLLTQMFICFTFSSCLWWIKNFDPPGKTEIWRESWEGGSHLYTGLIHNRLRWAPRLLHSTLSSFMRHQRQTH